MLARVPELPEVEALALDLRGRLTDRAIARVDIAAFSALKTFDPPLSALYGALVEDVTRHGKFLDITASGLHLVVHLSRAGVGPLARRGAEAAAEAEPQVPARGPGGARRRLRARHHRGRHAEAARDLRGPQALRRARDRAARARPARRGLHDRRARADPRRRRSGADQGRAATPGDDRGHRQRLLRRAAPRGADVAVQAGVQHRGRRPAGFCTTRSAPCSARPSSAPGASPRPTSRAKKSHLAVHGRTGQPCPVCGDTVREVSFADSSLQYCPTCQTGGKPWPTVGRASS